MPIRYNRNKRGFSRTDSGGTYQINNGDPQNDDDGFNEEAFERAEDNYIDDILNYGY